MSSIAFSWITRLQVFLQVLYNVLEQHFRLMHSGRVPGKKGKPPQQVRAFPQCSETVSRIRHKTEAYNFKLRTGVAD